MNETEKQNTHGCAKLPGCSVGCEKGRAPCVAHSELSCARQDGEVLAITAHLLPKCFFTSLATHQGAGSGSGSGYSCSSNIINSPTWLVTSSHPLPGAAWDQCPLGLVTHPRAWFQVRHRCFELDVSGTVSNPEGLNCGG